jgi:hypothetical protein
LFAPMTGAHYGVSLKTTLDEVDVGFYALRYASEYPFLRFNFYAPPPTDPEAGEFFTAYPGGIDLYGASISGYVGNSTISGEIVTRWNTPLLGGSAVQQYIPFDYWHDGNRKLRARRYAPHASFATLDVCPRYLLG